MRSRRRMECGGEEVDGHAREGQRWNSTYQTWLGMTYQTHDFANSTTLWFSGSQMLLSLPAFLTWGNRAKLTGETHAVLWQPYSHLFGGRVLGVVLYCLLTAHTGYWPGREDKECWQLPWCSKGAWQWLTHARLHKYMHAHMHTHTHVLTHTLTWLIVWDRMVLTWKLTQLALFCMIKCKCLWQEGCSVIQVLYI